MLVTSTTLMVEIVANFANFFEIRENKSSRNFLTLRLAKINPREFFIV